MAPRSCLVPPPLSGASEECPHEMGRRVPSPGGSKGGEGGGGGHGGSRSGSSGSGRRRQWPANGPCQRLAATGGTPTGATGDLACRTMRWQVPLRRLQEEKREGRPRPRGCHGRDDDDTRAGRSPVIPPHSIGAVVARAQRAIPTGMHRACTSQLLHCSACRRWRRCRFRIEHPWPLVATWVGAATQPSGQ